MSVHVIVGWDHEYERLYAHGPVGPGEAEDTGGVFEVDIPADVWARFDRAGTEYDAALKAVIAVSGVSDDGRLLGPCGQWKGDITPGRRWWELEVARTDDPEGWPQRDAVGGHFDTPIEAEQFLESLPDTLHTIPAFTSRVFEVPKSSLRVAGPHGYPELVSACDTCGWSRDEHAAETTT